MNDALGERAVARGGVLRSLRYRARRPQATGESALAASWPRVLASLCLRQERCRLSWFLSMRDSLRTPRGARARGTGRNRTDDSSFADCRLTTWPRRPMCLEFVPSATPARGDKTKRVASTHRRHSRVQRGRRSVSCCRPACCSSSRSRCTRSSSSWSCSRSTTGSWPSWRSRRWCT